MAKEVKKQDGLVKPSEILSQDDFRGIAAPEFGGELSILSLEPGEGCYFTYAGHKQIKTSMGNGEATSHTGVLDDGKTVALPLAKVFQSNFSMANPQVGDKFAIFRNKNVIAKSGFKKGEELANYSVKKVESAQPQN